MTHVRPVNQLPRPVQEWENVWIPLPDGTRLAARVWLPEDAESDPVPAILEFIPYRKRDHTAPRDESYHPYIAGHGYACVRVDMRGNGESEGLMLDEYLPQEQEDGVNVIAWLSHQSWCSGTVGMVGISWGGFNGLQIAARRPPALKAIITLCSTDDRYGDDIHFKGGCLLGDNLGWGATMFALSTRAPDPLLVGERWREMWLERLEANPFWAAMWLRHQHRDAYWKHGSVCEQFDAIEAAVLAVGGWADPYSNAILRLVAGLKAPAKGLIGPWGHKYPHIGVPGPAIGFLQEMLRWWDHWLKGIDTGIMAEPALRAFIQDAPPTPHDLDIRAGHWAGEPSWPSPTIGGERWTLAPGNRLTRDGGPTGAPIEIRSPQTVGLAAGRFCPKLAAADLPGDQREDDAGSLCFDSTPLTAPLEILGPPVIELELASDMPQANLVVRLCDVAPDGRSCRVTFGVLNLSHRHGHETPVALVPGERVRIRLQLDDIGHRFAAGQRIRVAISTAYWPMIWPAPEVVTLSVTPGTSYLHLPVRPPRPEDAAIAFPPVETAPPIRLRQLSEPETVRRVSRDLTTGETLLEVIDDSGRKRLDDHGLETHLIARERSWIGPDDPATARVETHWSWEMGRGDWSLRSETRTSMRADRENFYLTAELQAFEGEKRVFMRSWAETIPRQAV